MFNHISRVDNHTYIVIKNQKANLKNVCPEETSAPHLLVQEIVEDFYLKKVNKPQCKEVVENSFKQRNKKLCILVKQKSWQTL